MVRPKLRTLTLAALLVIAAACGTSSSPATRTPLTADLSHDPPPKQALDDRRCDEIAEKLHCPPDGEARAELISTGETGILCSARCYRGERAHGEAALVDVGDDRFEERGEHADGEKQGVWTRWEQHPETLQRFRQREQAFLAGKRHGAYREWYPNGTLREEGAYIRGEKDGRWRRYSPSGVWVFEGTFDRGVPVGPHRERYLNGQVATRREYDAVGRPHGQWCFYQRDATEIDCFELSGGTGVVREYDREGELTKEIALVDGKRHGRYVDFGPEGRFEAEYVDGLRDGISRLFDGECVLRHEAWVDGKRHGPTFEQDCDVEPPAKLVEGSYCRDKRCGRWIQRDAAGQTLEVTEYSASGEVLGHVEFGEEGEIEDLREDDTP